MSTDNEFSNQPEAEAETVADGVTNHPRGNGDLDEDASRPARTSSSRPAAATDRPPGRRRRPRPRRPARRRGGPLPRGCRRGDSRRRPAPARRRRRGSRAPWSPRGARAPTSRPSASWVSFRRRCTPRGVTTPQRSESAHSRTSRRPSTRMICFIASWKASQRERRWPRAAMLSITLGQRAASRRKRWSSTARRAPCSTCQSTITGHPDLGVLVPRAQRVAGPEQLRARPARRCSPAG